MRPEQLSAQNISNKNHETPESKDEPLRTPGHKSTKRFTFLTLLVGHLNERYSNASIGHAIRRGLTPITIGLVFVSAR